MQEQHIDDSRSVLQKKRWQELLGGNQIAKRVVLALSFLLILTCFLHFRETRLEVLEVGTQAPRYVISQTDFNFLDEEATQTLKQEAVRDIGAIYKVDENQVHAYRRDFENSLIEHQQWRQELPRSTFEEVYTVLDKIEESVMLARFTDDRTLNKMLSLKIPSSDFFALSSSAMNADTTTLPKPLWTEIQNKLKAEKKYYSETVDYLVAAFSRHAWFLQQDFAMERTVRQKVQSVVADRYTHIEAGAQIIKKGEKVAPRQISMLQSMKSALAESQNRWNPLSLLGSALIALSLMVAALIYLHYFQRELLKSLQKMVLLVTIIVMSMLVAKLAEYLLIYHAPNMSEAASFPLVLPFAALLICVLIGSEVAAISSFFLLVVFGATLAFEYAPFLLVNFFAAVVTILFARRLHKRKKVFAVCGKVWLCIIPLIVAFNLTGNGSFDVNFITDLVSTFVFLSATAVLSVGLLPILEALFHVMTDMTLMEYMDPDHELLRRLSLEAPGTYQHCLVVGNISEAAARAIGANGLFCRVSTLYHDIGKLFNPHYFTENQLGGFNIHQLLTPAESTHVIIAHVPEGEALARKYHLPQSFIDVIREHHGTTMVYYFYCKQVEQMGGDATKVSEKVFRYPGPKPRSKESAIIMIADTVEAASRSMDEVTEESVADMVDKLVAEKAEDGQFDECQLTFEELGRVKRAIVKALMVTRHLRIKYPDRQ
ncbi:MAG: HDIG domain-containing protein [Verrucomicrobia bacterium]|nr:HDIG domain-containing protein [Verrucomicrobiota bacterium]